MNIAIVGCGLIGNKRASNLGSHTLVAAADTIMERAVSLASHHPGASAVASWQRAVEHKDVDIVIVATTPDQLASVTLGALESGKHVLVDKPAARNARELAPVMKLAERCGKKVRVGFNHRYHPSVLKACEIVEAGKLGPLMFVRGRYGHGGRPGYEKEWRANPEIGGGGELLDQGMHLIDLSRLFLGDFVHVDGYVDTYFWDMPVEDNGFMALRTERNQMAWLHVSWTEWKNLFCLEIFGRHGKLQIDGLGGSYGVEQLAYYRMLDEMGPPETTIWQYPGRDLSWRNEFDAFIDDIRLDRKPVPGVEDGYAALVVIDRIYEQQLAMSGGKKA